MTEHKTGLRATATARVIKAADTTAQAQQQQPEAPAAEGSGDDGR
jgi:hypothetical protein